MKRVFEKEIQDEAMSYAMAATPIAVRSDENHLREIIMKAYRAGCRKGAHIVIKIVMEKEDQPVHLNDIDRVLDFLTEETSSSKKTV